MKKFSLFFIIMVVFFIGCEKKVDFTAKEVHWDRDMCERCKMVLSDRKFSAQVINPKNGRTYFFDDIGCAILWFQEEKIAWANEAIIWVNDAKNGAWIDARKASFSTKNITPMAYGFGAHARREDIVENQEIIDFEAMRKRIIEIGK
ncbi:MAG: hypothetical protein IBX44_01905 [Sulfurospirillum sp.]|nr:hypothetical protein [Sulfurospirillum sp.]